MRKLRHTLIDLARTLRPLFPQWLVNYVYHLPLAYLAARMYGNPGEELEIIGVTGTDGKTTTSTLIYHILRQSHKKVALISTVEAKIGRQSIDTGFHVTTPDPFLLQRLLRRIKSQKIRYVVLEVTSHGLDQFRFYPLRPKIAVLTNITHEHLDYHGTFARYVDAKLKLFRHAEHAVVNKDLPIFTEINQKLSRVLFSTYSITSPSQLQAEDVTEIPGGTSFRIGKITYKIPLTGTYNVANALAAISVALLLGISQTDIKRALLSFPGIKGRLDPIANKRSLHAYVDFAHTPHALESVLANLASQKRKGERLIVVFGAAGLRDASKRPLMGRAAARYADRIVLTSEDPRTEDPAAIAAAIQAGIPSADQRKVKVVINRGEAIDLAVNKLAKPGDWIIVCGKGHEQSMNLDGYTETPWSDHEALSAALKSKKQV
jgi:UDP-N-acetylmuramoyl-L-alanyl-D-glutamate--2,6-diaminopimelate ligase